MLMFGVVPNHKFLDPFSWAGDIVNMVVVPSDFVVADDEIVKRLDVGDLVITADIPLASEVIDRRCGA